MCDQLNLGEQLPVFGKHKIGWLACCDYQGRLQLMLFESLPSRLRSSSSVVGYCCAIILKTLQLNKMELNDDKSALQRVSSEIESGFSGSKLPCSIANRSASVALLTLSTAMASRVIREANLAWQAVFSREKKISGEGIVLTDSNPKF